MSKVILETERLLMREFNAGDEDDLLRLNGDPDVMRYVGPGQVQTREQVQAGLGRLAKLYQDHPGYGSWATFDKALDEFVGACLLVPYPEANEVEVGYRFFKDHWGKGYATEGTKALIQYGFKELGLNRIIAIAYPENKASIRVMQKCDMKDEGIIHNDQLDIDVVYYTIDAE